MSDFIAAYKDCKRMLGVLWTVDKQLFLGNLVVTMVPGFMPFVNAYIYKLMIDLIVGAIGGAPIDYSYLWILIAARAATLFVQDAASTAQRHYQIMLWTKLPAHLYQVVLSKLSSLDLEYFENSAFKDRLEQVRESYSYRPLNLVSYSFDTIQSFTRFAIAAVSIIALNWMLAAVVLVVTVPTLLFQSKYAKATWSIWSDNSPYRKRFSYLADLIQSGDSVKEIKLFQLARNFVGELKSIQDKFASENSWAVRRQSLTGFALNFLNVAAYVAIEVFIIFAAIAKRISIGDITYFTTVLSNFQSGANGLFRNATYLFDNAQYVREMFAVLDAKSKISTAVHPTKLEPGKIPKIEFKNVSFAYPGTEQKVLDNFSLMIEPGQKIAFVGENGAGKTTIVKLLGRFYDVDEGEILIDDVNIKKLDLNSWYDSLGVLFQDFIKYEYSLRDNIHFGKINAPNDLASVIDAANQAGADLVAEGLPKKYDQILGRTFEGGIDLSTGQWQKVALARGFYRNAAVLVLDEPTAAIDAKAESEIFKRVEKLSKNKTVLIISHRFSTVRNADRIYVIKDGKISESGSHKELMDVGGTYATLFKLQAKGYK